MRKCCCCISVHVGAFILGLLAIFISALELVVLIPYFFDVEAFNPIQDHLNQFFYVFEKLLKEQNFTKVREEEIVSTAKEWMWTALLVEACFTVVYAIIALSMCVGVQCRQRVLMLPYMIIQMAIVVLFIIVGIGATVLLFYISVVMGAICLGVVLIATFLFVYFWTTVQKAYVELGNRDYMYSPAPVKPIYNPPSEHKYQPSAPQQFSMD